MVLIKPDLNVLALLWNLNFIQITLQIKLPPYKVAICSLLQIPAG